MRGRLFLLLLCAACIKRVDVVRGEECAPRGGEIVCEVSVAGNGEQKRRIDQIERNHPLHETETIGGIAFRNNIYPFRGRIYDQDGFLGIYIPDNLVNDAKTEASSETVSAADVNFSGLTGIVSTGANAIVNAAKNVVTGSIRRTKVTLPANYKLIIKTNEK